jgi:hypothetical protein
MVNLCWVGDIGYRQFIDERSRPQPQSHGMHFRTVSVVAKDDMDLA